LAPVCYAEAILLGVKTLHTAIPPLADGSSLPSIVNTAKNVASLGFSPSVDLRAVDAVSGHFTRIAEQEGLEVGRPVEYSVSQYIHHIPGGVISHLRHQLNQIGKIDCLAEILEEVVRVRRDLGYPIMVTPFSQFVCSQATLNVIVGERYAQISDEIIQFASGHWGLEAASLIEPNVRDFILGRARAREIAAMQGPELSLADIRKRYGGPELSDEELLLRYIAPKHEVDAMHSAGAPRRYAMNAPPLLGLVEHLLRQRKFRQIRVRKGLQSISVSVGATAKAGHA
jgi:oxaloacetate decarboxylase alpha subunit